MESQISLQEGSREGFEYRRQSENGSRILCSWLQSWRKKPGSKEHRLPPEAGNRFSRRVSRRNQPSQHLDFSLLKLTSDFDL